MRYIDKYKHFNTIKDTLYVVDDILFELSDDGYIIGSKIVTRNKISDSIEVRIDTNEGDKLKSFDPIDRLLEYIKSTKLFDDPKVWISFLEKKTHIQSGKPITINELYDLFNNNEINISFIKLTFTLI